MMDGCIDRFVEIVGFEPPLLQQSLLPPDVIPSLIVYVYIVHYYCFNASSAERLASGSSLYD